MVNKFAVVGAVVLVVALMAGCGGSRPSRVPVSGTVLIDGKPVTVGYVQFAPADSRPSIGMLDATGHFVLTCFEPGDGAVVGKHTVTVVAKEAIGQETIKWYAPKKYAELKESGLEQTVSEPTDSVKIELTWGGEKGPIVERR